MNILDAALGYVERMGAWPIIPIVPGNKRPAIKTGRDHAEGATFDIATIRDWHRRGLLEAIGTPAGAASGTVVIDIDVKHDGAWHMLAELEDVLGPLPRSKVSRTRSGGQHIYCRHPGDRRVLSGGPKGNIAKLCGNRPGIDVRADGGLVVLPPSLGYSWIADEDGSLEPLPLKWLLAINGAGNPPRVASTVAAPACSDELRVKRASRYLAKMSPAIAFSGGHDALWAAVIAMMWGFDLDTDTVRALIANEFNPRCDPPWDERELDHKLVGAERAGRLDRGYLLKARAA